VSIRVAAAESPNADGEHLGSSGLSMLKTLREDGFKVTCYERRSQVGGLWAYTDDTSMTTALPSELTSENDNLQVWLNGRTRYLGHHQQVYLRNVRFSNARQYGPSYLLRHTCYLSNSRVSTLLVSSRISGVYGVVRD